MRTIWPFRRTTTEHDTVPARSGAETSGGAQPHDLLTDEDVKAVSQAVRTLVGSDEACHIFLLHSSRVYELYLDEGVDQLTVDNLAEEKASTPVSGGADSAPNCAMIPDAGLLSRAANAVRQDAAAVVAIASLDDAGLQSGNTVAGWLELLTAFDLSSTLRRLETSVGTVTLLLGRSAAGGHVAALPADETHNVDAGDGALKRLDFFTLHDGPEAPTPAPVRRAWMDETPDQHPYRCLPLNIANAHGWELICPTGLTAIWNGGGALEDIVVEHDEELQKRLASSHFGNGVLTFHVSGIFRTEPGFDLWVGGPVNHPKNHVYPLTGVVETDWLEFTFTMNWKMMSPNFPIRFEENEPFCTVFPVPRGMIESFDPVIRDIDEDPELKANFDQYLVSRNSFNADLRIGGSKASQQRWQRKYIRGPETETPLMSAHRTKVRIRPFRRNDGEA